MVRFFSEGIENIWYTPRYSCFHSWYLDGACNIIYENE